jgi:multimeric flavodoxin WrbA
MKILGLSFSPREHGNTELLLNKVFSGAGRLGAETELFRVSGKKIEPCAGCGSCYKTGECRIQDDMQELYAKLLAADGIVFGTPVYYYNMTAQGKTIIDRTLALGHSDKGLRNKIGGVIAVGGSLGLVDAVKDLYFFMVIHQMIPANFIAAYASNKGDVEKLNKCNQAAVDLGMQMVRIAERNFKYPDEFRANHIGFGTHTW